MIHMIRKVIAPWLLACSACILIVAVMFAVLPLHGGVPQEPERVTDTAQKNDDREPALEQQLLSFFSLEPSGTKNVSLVAAMIENHVDARPYQRGLHEAAIIFEMIVEGDITRFLALFPITRLPAQIGPIRSLRPHFVSAIEGYRPLLLHAGGSALAYQAFAAHPEILHHDGIRYDGETYERDSSVPAPHNLFMAREKLLPLLERLKSSLKEIPLPLFDVGTDICRGVACHAPTANIVSVGFGDPLHDVRFTYDPSKRNYIRSTGAAPAQAFPTNILILEAEVQGYGVRDAIPWTKTFGGGKLLLFRDGKKSEGTWMRKKGEVFSFKDRIGIPLTFSRGQVWMMFLPSLTMLY